MINDRGESGTRHSGKYNFVTQQNEWGEHPIKLKRAKGRRAEKTIGCGLIFALWTEVKMPKHGDTVMRFLENLHRNIANRD
jgi:hypothetical protein